MTALDSSLKSSTQASPTDNLGSGIVDGTVKPPAELSHEEIMREFLEPEGGFGELSPSTDESVIGFLDDKQPRRSGVQEMLEVTKLLNEADIPCCMVAEAALIYYGAGRMMDVSLLQTYHLSLYSLIRDYTSNGPSASRQRK